MTKNKRKLLIVGFFVSMLISLCCAFGCSVGNTIDMNGVIDGYGYTVNVRFEGMGGLWNNHYDHKLIKVEPNSYLPEPGVSNTSVFAAPLLTRGIIIGWYTDYTENDDGVIEWDEEDRWNFREDKVGEQDFTLYCRWDVTKVVTVHQESIQYSITIEEIDGHYNWLIPLDSPISVDKSKTFSHYSLEEGGEPVSYTTKVIDGVERKVLDLTELFAHTSDVDVYVVWNVNFTEVSSLSELQRAAAENANIRLTADINLDGASSPFRSISYKGIFDGQGHTISNSAMTVGATEGTGFFAALYGATVKNVRFEGINITVQVRRVTDATGTAKVGVLAGIVGEGCTIEDVEFVNCAVKKDILAAVESGWTIKTNGWYGDVLGDVDTSKFTVTGTVTKP